MKNRPITKPAHERPIVLQPVVAVEFLECDVRWQTGPAELVENRLRRLLPTGALPLNSSTFRKR